ncbi:MAG: PTS sugar transporter subunit IIA [Gemmataceae bacterium]|nr:PTS sugar transporter subunit IIA [Gemmataceae bacterium]
MRMSDFIFREAIIPELKSKDKEGVVRELVESLSRAGCFKESETEDIIRAVLKRELLGSTGIWPGIAIPHSKHPGVGKLVGTMGISSKGVDFGSRDGTPAFVFILIISPVDQPVVHLRALEAVSRVLKEPAYVQNLKSAGTGPALFELLGKG